MRRAFPEECGNLRAYNGVVSREITLKPVATVAGCYLWWVRAPRWLLPSISLSVIIDPYQFYLSAVFHPPRFSRSGFRSPLDRDWRLVNPVFME